MHVSLKKKSLPSRAGKRRTKKDRRSYERGKPGRRPWRGGKGRSDRLGTQGPSSEGYDPNFWEKKCPIA